jgi:hypothetical protein
LLKFTCFNYLNSNNRKINLNAFENDWYIVFHNPTKRCNQIVKISVEVSSKIQKNFVQIVKPNTSIFSHSIIIIGDKVNLSGLASKDLNLFFAGKEIRVNTTDNRWKYQLDTSDFNPGNYKVYATCGNCTDTKYIELIDPVPPEIEIENPANGEIFEKGIIEISGRGYDNQEISTIEVSIDGGPYKLAQGKTEWSIEINLLEYDIGIHKINVKAIDINGNLANESIIIVVNESRKQNSIEINEVFHKPINPTNTSNIFIYANISSSGPFDVKDIILYLNDSSSELSHSMYEYGNNPVQTRHEEDILYNQSNSPLFGFEIGEFSSGEKIRCYIVVIDSANNVIQSEEMSFSIQ